MNATFLPGQGCVLHSVFSTASPAHGFPPCFGGEPVRVRLCDPPTHVLLHFLYAPQGPHLPSTER